MWRILFLELLLTIGLTLSNTQNAAILNCDLSEQTCDNNEISEVSFANQDVIVSGSPDHTFPEQNTLSFYNPTIFKFIPTKIFHIFPDVKYFTLSHVGLSNLITNAFDNCGSLVSITITGNDFPVLSASFAEKCQNLQILSLYSNNIKFLDPDALKGLANLQTIQLTRNLLTCIPQKLFADNAHLQTVDFSHNQISAVNPMTFVGLTNLMMINLGFNHISYIPDFNFSNVGMSSGINLLLDGNPVTAIHPEFIKHMKKMVDQGLTIHISLGSATSNMTLCIEGNLFIQSNDLEGASESLSQCFDNYEPSLDESSMKCEQTATNEESVDNTELSMRTSACGIEKTARCFMDHYERYTCTINEIDSGITAIKSSHLYSYTDLNVTRVYLPFCYLNRIPPVLFTQYPNIKFLSAVNCSLGQIDEQSFTKCENLQVVDLSFNRITRISGSALRSCTELRTIDLTGNPIEHLVSELYESNKNLKKIFFNRSPELVLD